MAKITGVTRKSRFKFCTVGEFKMALMIGLAIVLVSLYFVVAFNVFGLL